MGMPRVVGQPNANTFRSHGASGAALSTESITGVIVGAAIEVHRRLGPGLLESVYSLVLAHRLERAGLRIERNRSIPVEIDGLRIDNAFRVDLLVEDRVVVELKSVETLIPVHSTQVLTYLRLLDLPIGLLINFGAPTLKEGLRRIVNTHSATFDASFLRVK